MKYILPLLLVFGAGAALADQCPVGQDKFGKTVMGPCPVAPAPVCKMITYPAYNPQTGVLGDAVEVVIPCSTH